MVFAVLRAVTRFLELPLRDQALRVVCFPYFVAKAVAAAASGEQPAPLESPYKTLHELPPLPATDPVTSARAPFDFASLKGRPVLVVNVASACGLTAQNYAELAEARGARVALQWRSAGAHGR